MSISAIIQQPQSRTSGSPFRKSSKRAQTIYVDKLRHILETNRPQIGNRLATHRLSRSQKFEPSTTHTKNQLTGVKEQVPQHENEHEHEHEVEPHGGEDKHDEKQHYEHEHHQEIEEQEDEQIHLPKIKKKQKYSKQNKYTLIDDNDKKIIRNYMNAYLVEFKTTKKSAKKSKKKHSHSIDNVNQLPLASAPKHFNNKLSTPIQTMRVQGNQQSALARTQNQSPIFSKTQTVNSMGMRNYEISNSSRLKSVVAVSQKIQKNTMYGSEKKNSLKMQARSPVGKRVPAIEMPEGLKNFHKEQVQKRDNHEERYRESQKHGISQSQQKSENSKIYRSDVQKQGKDWQIIDPLTLQTFFIKMKKLVNTSPQPSRISKMQKFKVNIPKIPTRQNMSSFIKSYIPEFNQIKIQQLVKADSFQIIQDQEDEDNVSFYFGETNEEGKRSGKGILITHKSYFEGYWQDDHKFQGLDVSQLGKYKGQFKDGLRSGKGEFFWSHGEYYSGEWRNGKKFGSGYWRSLKGESYMGEWRNGQVTGYGVHTMKTGQKYEGEFVNFLKHGFGIQIFPNGDIYEGRYIQGQAHGKGKYTWKCGVVYEGQFVDGYREGKGTITAPSHLKFEGLFKEDMLSGMGRLELCNGDVFNGMFEGNKKNGQGLLDLKAERRLIKGIWKDNELVMTEDK